MAAVNTYVGGLPVYVLHTGPGVRDDPKHATKLRPSSFAELPGASELFGGLAKTKDYVPKDVFTWTPAVPGSDAFPFTIASARGVTLGARRGNAFILGLSGLEGTVDLEARAAMRLRSIDPLTGRVTDERDLRPGGGFTVNRRAAVLVGTITGSAP
jgi:hypothetical protein